VGSIPASRTNIRKTKGLKSNLQAFFLFRCTPGFTVGRRTGFSSPKLIEGRAKANRFRKRMA
jgi:hypothetical protein